ncbi:hypothetical protein [Streptomyces sp. NPDC002994]|uniref:hypothetical protein n=1 Tax=Streptomyces sp. NPDC002994 TaxID=3154441 RepID=UPI0033B019F2
MAKTVTGVGRVTVFPLLHRWPDTHGVVAYTTTGHFGDTAIVGYIPIAEVPDVHLMEVAARHAVGQSRRAHTEWVLCTGWSSRVVPKPRTLHLPDAAWSLEVEESSELEATMYGHRFLRAGRFTLTTPNHASPDEQLMSQARGVLPDRSRAAAELALCI